MYSEKVKTNNAIIETAKINTLLEINQSKIEAEVAKATADEFKKISEVLVKSTNNHMAEIIDLQKAIINKINISPSTTTVEVVK